MYEFPWIEREITTGEQAEHKSIIEPNRSVKKYNALKGMIYKNLIIGKSISITRDKIEKEKTLLTSLIT